MTPGKRALSGLLVFAVLTGTPVLAFWPTIPDVDKQTPLVATSPPPSHIEWTQHPVGGLLLCQPPDSLGKLNCLTLPPGSILAVPHLVEGEDPDSTRTKT